MKPKIKRHHLLWLVVLLCIGVFGFAISKSSTFRAPAKPQLTRQAVAQKAHQVATPSPKQPSSADLPNSGSGNQFIIVGAVSLLGATLTYVITLRRLTTRLG